MDSEELAEIAFHQKNGRPETTKGPYYHKAWWESYKGAVKGIIGGIMVGGLIGAVVGGAVVGALALSAGASVATGYAGIILAATTLFGMYEGKEKFEKVGVATGAVAAASEVSEVRMKQYVREKFTGLTNEIRELKAVLAGKQPIDSIQTDPAKPDNAAIFDESDFRTTHCDEHCAPQSKKIMYWNVAAIGALVGAAVTAIIAFTGGGVEGILGEVIKEHAISTAAANTALITTGTALGASFGINRDIFRKVFDVTDCWFAGVTKGNCSSVEIAQAKGVEIPHLAPHKPMPAAYPIKTIVSDSTPSTIITESTIAARNALLSMDHTTAVRH